MDVELRGHCGQLALFDVGGALTAKGVCLLGHGYLLPLGVDQFVFLGLLVGLPHLFVFVCLLN